MPLSLGTPLRTLLSSEAQEVKSGDGGWDNSCHIPAINQIMMVLTIWDLFQ
jgi:hypothetical protein